jgi:hypothetical protein
MSPLQTPAMAQQVEVGLLKFGEGSTSEMTRFGCRIALAIATRLHVHGFIPIYLMDPFISILETPSNSHIFHEQRLLVSRLLCCCTTGNMDARCPSTHHTLMPLVLPYSRCISKTLQLIL